MRQRLHDLSHADEHEQDERHRGEERVEGERAREERQVGLVGRLQGAAQEADG
jgi:hypothetical protein